MKQEIFILPGTVVPASFSRLAPVQELEAEGGSLFILLCVVLLCSGMAENGIYLIFVVCIMTTFSYKQVSTGTIRV